MPSPTLSAAGRFLRTYPLTIVAFAGGIAGLAWFPRWLADDAFILFRYADNLARHGQLTFNPGQTPVEGYTGILYPLLLAALRLPGIPADVAGPWLLPLSTLGGALFLVWIFNLLTAGEIVRGGCVLLYFSYPLIYLHSASGMETMLFTTAMLAAIYSFLRLFSDRGKFRHREAYFAAALLILGLARPEGVAFAAFLFCAALATYRKLGRATQPLWKRVLLFFILPGAAYFVWRFSYYGHLLPNTFYAKRHAAGWNPAVWLNLQSFFFEFLFLPAGGILLGAAFLIAGRQSRPETPVASRESGLSLAAAAAAMLLFAATLILTYARAELWMNFFFRFWMPLLPPVIALLGVTLGRAFSGLGRSPERASIRRFLLPAFAAVILGGQLVLNLQAFPVEVRYARDYALLHEEEHRPAGRYLRDQLRPDQTVAVFIDAGRIPYYADRPAIDFGGLNDPFLPFSPRDAQTLREYFFRRQPAAVAATSFAWDHLAGLAEFMPIAADARFQSYRLVEKFRSRSPITWYLFIYRREEPVE
ncbi:MAG: hypothetical protein GX444_13150 [Myxococcales bacterium]|nr:hypothetical protein [Myxococcales bacterium]